MDEELFPNPKRFRPERYIENPSLIDKVSAFGLGKRQCLGESLARMELFMIFVTILQHFEVRPRLAAGEFLALAQLSLPASVDPDEVVQPYVNFASHPQPHELTFKRRTV